LSLLNCSKYKSRNNNKSHEDQCCFGCIPIARSGK